MGDKQLDSGETQDVLVIESSVTPRTGIGSTNHTNHGMTFQYSNQSGGGISTVEVAKPELAGLVQGAIADALSEMIEPRSSPHSKSPATKNPPGTRRCSALMVRSPADILSSQVWLHIYDTDTYTGWMNNRLLKDINLGVFHCGVEIYTDEWSFHSAETYRPGQLTGIVTCRPKRMAGSYVYRESISMGVTPLSLSAVDAIIEDLRPVWPASSYHPIRRNCVTFAETFLERLQVNEEFPEWVKRLNVVSTTFPALGAVMDASWSLMHWWSQAVNDPVGCGRGDDGGRRGVCHALDDEISVVDTTKSNCSYLGNPDRLNVDEWDADKRVA